MKTAVAEFCCQVITCNDTFETQTALDRHTFTAPGHHFCRMCRTQCQDAVSLEAHVDSQHPKFTVLTNDPYVIHIRLTADPNRRDAQFAEAVARLRGGLKGRKFQLVPDATYEPAPGIRQAITYYAIADDLEIILEGALTS